MKKIFVFSVLLAAVSAAASAQSADAVSALLEQKRATISDIAYFSAASLGLIQEDESSEKSLELLAQAGVFKTAKEASKPATYADIAYLCTSTWGIKGGIWYTKFPSPRYAFKELKARGIIPINADPGLYISGREALRIITKCAELEQENNPVRAKAEKFLAEYQPEANSESQKPEAAAAASAEQKAVETAASPAEQKSAETAPAPADQKAAETAPAPAEQKATETAPAPAEQKVIEQSASGQTAETTPASEKSDAEQTAADKTSENQEAVK